MRLRALVFAFTFALGVAVTPRVEEVNIIDYYYINTIAVCGNTIGFASKVGINPHLPQKSF